MIRSRKLVAAVVIGLGSLVSSLRAGDLFSITATPSGESAISTSGKSMIDLVNNVVNSKDQFATLQDKTFSASLNYAGLANAITVQQTNNPGDVTSTINIPSIGFTKTFTGSSTDDVKNQIEDFLKKDGSSTLSQFISKVNTLTLAGVTDGNPLASTALMSKQAYLLWGVHRSPLTGASIAGSGGTETRFDFIGGASSTDAGDGTFAQLNIGTTWRWTDNLSLNVSLPMMYRDIEGSQVFHAGLMVGLPITILPARGENTLNWCITPSGFVAGSGSIDLVSGGVLWGAHLTSSLSYTVSEFTFTLANQFGMYQGIPISWGDYKFDTDVDQTILRNGVGVTKAFGNVFVDANIAYTNFLEDAAVKSYWSPGAGVGFRWGSGNASALRIGYAGDMGHGFDVHGIEAQVIFSY